MDDLSSLIVRSAAELDEELLVQPFDFDTDRQNQLLFFFKPECFLVEGAQRQRAIVELALELFQRYGVEVAGTLLLSGPRLGQLEIMDRHYGFINRVSRELDAVLQPEDLREVRQATGAEAATPVLGGHQFLAQHKDFDPSSLDELWLTRKSIKIRSGLYVEQYQVAGQACVLANAFHPAQLAHFTDPGRRIAILLLHSDTPWSVLRDSMLGDTFPERAAPGSFRRTLCDAHADFGLPPVGIANNCAHLSAGPFEGLFELHNFLSRTDSVPFQLEQARQAQWLRRVGVQPEQALDNPHSDALGESLFDATEGLDARSSAALQRLFFAD